MTTVVDAAQVDTTPELVAQVAVRAVRWSPVLVASALAAVLHLLWGKLLATPGGDIAAQDAWAAFAKAHPGSAYDLAWYGGMHPVSYSAVSPYLMAVLGVRPTMVVAGTLTAGLLALLLERNRFVTRPMIPSVVGAVALTGNAVSGRVTFGLGMLFGVATLLVVFAWPVDPRQHPWLSRLRWLLIVLLTAIATSASAVAGMFLGLVAAALWLTGRHKLAYAVGLPPVAVVAVSAWLFPLSGVQPMAWNSAILPTVAALTAVLLFPRDWRLLRVLGWVYLVAVQLSWLVPSPVGTNIGRLGLSFAAVGLTVVVVERVPAERPPWTTSLAARRLGRRVTIGLLAASMITLTSWQVATATQDAITTAPPASLSLDLDPLVDQLQARGAALGRVEMVPTASHREATALAPYVNLARGWNRQADAARNRIFYRDQPLTADAYQRWLRNWAVRFVVTSNAAPDAAAVEESALVTAGLPYLQRVWSDAQWSLYAVHNPRSLASAPGEVIDFDSAEVTLYTPVAGPVVVRIGFSRWLSLLDEYGKPLPGPPEGDTSPQPCLSGLANGIDDDGPEKQPYNWLVLHATHPGVYHIGAPYKMPRGSACPSS
ncbi:MAG: MFS transporter [Nocardioides sp.]